MKTPFAPTLLALAMLAPMAAWSQVSISIGIAPPPLPVYTQPAIPGDGYLWTPGYWGWNVADNGYFWVPGTWVLAPTPGFLWTPGYWGFYGGNYRWNVGYWGPRVGFYGGINYGHGYGGRGYEGGRWERGAFHYNTAVNNVNTTIVHNVYNTRVVTNNTYNITRVSYNGGTTGVRAQPTAVEEQVRREKHIDATPNQVEHERIAMREPAQKASVNHGVPQVAATPRPAAFDAPQAVKAVDPTAARRGRPAGSNVAQDKAAGDAPARQAERTAQTGAQGGQPESAPKARAAKPEPRAMNGTPQAQPQPANGDGRQVQARPAPAQPRAAGQRPENAPEAPNQPNARGNGKGSGGDATRQQPDAEPQAKGRAAQETRQAQGPADAEPRGKQNPRE